MSNIVKKILLKRGLFSTMPVLDEGELGFATDQKKLYIGTTNGNQQVSIEQDVIDSLLIDNQLNSDAIDKLEATINKIDLGLDVDTASGEDIISLGADVLATNGEVLVEGVSLYAKQLVTNGDFSDGTTGWLVNSSELSIENDKLKVIKKTAGSNFRTYTLNVDIKNGNKYYMFIGHFKQSIIGTYGPVAWFGLSDSAEQQVVVFENTTNEQINSSEIKTADSDYNSVVVLNYGQTIGEYFLIDNITVFNISDMIANKQYSPLYNKTFDNMTDNEIKAQMDKWVQDGTLPNDEIQSVGGSKRVKSVGKNIYIDDLDNWEQGTLSNVGAPSESDTTIRTKDSKSIKLESGSYTISVKNGYELRGRLYTLTGEKYENVGDGYSQSHNFSITTPSLLKITLRKVGTPNITPSIYFEKFELQLELGSSATAYQPYISNDLYLDSLPNLNRLPNGVKDTIEYRNGKYYYVQRVKKYTLQASDIGTVSTASNWDIDTFELTLSNLNSSILDTSTITGKAYFEETGSEFPFNQRSHITIDNVRWYVSGTTGNIILATPKGTYTQAQLQTLLAGTDIYYQLATPIEQEITSIGTLLPQPHGTVYITNEVAEVGIYDSGLTTTRQATSIVELYILNNDGTKTKLTNGVISGNTITSASLTDGDLVFVSYEYDALDGYNVITYKKDNVARKSELIDAYDKTETNNLLDDKTDQTYTDALFLEASDNLAIPDLTGKTHLGGGVYEISRQTNNTYTYDVVDGIFELTKEHMGFSYSDFLNLEAGEYTITLFILDGGIEGNTNMRFTADNLTTNFVLSDKESKTFSISGENKFEIRPVVGAYTGFKFKLMLNKGSAAKPHQVPIAPQLHALKLGHIDKLNWQFVDGKIDAVKPVDTGWLTPSLLNGWTLVGLTTFEYRKIGNVVYFSGRLDGTNATSNTIMNIPIGFRPSKDFAIWNGDSSTTNVIMNATSGGVLANYSRENSVRIEFSYVVD